MKRTLIALAIAAVTTVSTIGLAPVANAASTASATPSIIGGSVAPATPWAVQLTFVQGFNKYGCTGEQINASWVITAKHCVDGISSMDVFHSNSTSSRGTAAPANAVYSAPAGDIGLVHLARPYALSSYPTLNLSYGAQSSGTGTILGYGRRANSVQSTGLYQATENLTGSGSDAYGGRAQHVNGSDGAANHGDSGGPLIIGNNIVAVCSRGDVADPGADIHAVSYYAILSQSAAWIRTTAGV